MYPAYTLTKWIVAELGTRKQLLRQSDPVIRQKNVTCQITAKYVYVAKKHHFDSVGELLLVLAYLRRLHFYVDVLLSCCVGACRDVKKMSRAHLCGVLQSGMIDFELTISSFSNHGVWWVWRRRVVPLALRPYTADQKKIQKIISNYNQFIK